MTAFHIHVDAAQLAEDFENYLVREFGFWRTDFEGGAADADSYEPANHLTLKPATSEHFKDVFDRVIEYAHGRALRADFRALPNPGQSSRRNSRAPPSRVPPTTMALTCCSHTSMIRPLFFQLLVA